MNKLASRALKNNFGVVSQNGDRTKIVKGTLWVVRASVDHLQERVKFSLATSFFTRQYMLFGFEEQIIYKKKEKCPFEMGNSQIGMSFETSLKLVPSNWKKEHHFLKQQ